MIKIDFSFDTTYGKFSDALYLPDGHGLSDEEIDALKAQRRDRWVELVSNPPTEAPSNFVELDGVLYEKVELDGKNFLKPVQE